LEVLGPWGSKDRVQVPLAWGVVACNNVGMETPDFPTAASSNAGDAGSNTGPETDLGIGATIEAKPFPKRPKLDKLPQYRVLLHDDDINTDVFVVQTLVELTPLNQAAAFDVTELAQKQGVAQVLVTHKERAELYMEQFGSKKLTVTIEPAE
jgi:ATP-dependent Clp protease adaptor protein ClpS